MSLVICGERLFLSELLGGVLWELWPRMRADWRRQSPAAIGCAALCLQLVLISQNLTQFLVSGWVPSVPARVSHHWGIWAGFAFSNCWGRFMARGGRPPGVLFPMEY